METGVYAIVNLLNGNAYIGSASKSFRSRFSRHLSELRAGQHHSQHLQAAWNKYGADVFEFSPVQLAPPDDVLQIEQAYIDAWRPEYNICPTAGSQRGHKRSDEFKAKQRATFGTPESKARRAEATRDSWADPESKARRLTGLREAAKNTETQLRRGASIRKAASGQNAKERRIAAAKDVNSRPDVKAKLREHMHRLWADEAYVEAWTAGHSKPATRAIMSAKAKARFDDPEYRARMLAIRRASSVLTIDLANEIRVAVESESMRVVAHRYGVSQSLVSLIKLNKRWVK